MHRTAFKRVKNHLLAVVKPATRTAALATVLLICACEQPDKEYNYSIFAFGTLIDISLYGVNRQQAQLAFEQLQKDFDFYHQHWSPWTNGDLARLNKQLSKPLENQAIKIPAHLIPIINISTELSLQSSNYYNPTIGRLINLWQFHKYQDDNIQPPDNKQIQQLISNKPQMSDLTLSKNGLLTNSNPAVALNFGAFAKGYAIALEIEQLKKLHINNAVINAGGDLSAIGTHGERAWNIGIRHPRENSILASVEVHSNESVFTSGDYERFYMHQGRRYHHILDPATGYPAMQAQSVTVIHEDAGRADAAATALFVAGSKHWQTVAKNMQLTYVLLIDAEGNIHLTPAMAKRIKFLNKSPTSRVIPSEEL